MAYWLHCQACQQWSKSATPLSEDKYCSFCNNQFIKIKPYPIDNAAAELKKSKTEITEKNSILNTIEQVKSSGDQNTVEKTVKYNDPGTSDFNQAIVTQEAIEEQESSTPLENCEVGEQEPEIAEANEETTALATLQSEISEESGELLETTRVGGSLATNARPEDYFGAIETPARHTSEKETLQQLGTPNTDEDEKLPGEEDGTETTSSNEDENNEETGEDSEIFEEFETDDLLATEPVDDTVEPGEMRINFIFETPEAKKTETIENGVKQDQNGDNQNIEEIDEPENLKILKTPAERETEKIPAASLPEAVEENGELVASEFESPEAPHQFEVGELVSIITIAGQPENSELPELEVASEKTETVEALDSSTAQEMSESPGVPDGPEAILVEVEEADQLLEGEEISAKARPQEHEATENTGDLPSIEMTEKLESCRSLDIPEKNDTHDNAEPSQEQVIPDESIEIEIRIEDESAIAIDTDEVTGLEEANEKEMSDTRVPNDKRETTDILEMVNTFEKTKTGHTREDHSPPKMTRTHEKYIEMKRRRKNQHTIERPL